MTSEIFGPPYARTYDAVYRDKGYAAESTVLIDAFERYSPRPVRRVLDLGCGTGGHALVLEKSGYEVVGVDRSDAMLAEARRKAQHRGQRIKWILGDIRSLELNETFDAAIMMFAVLGYQTDDGDVRATLRSARAHLLPGGILACDVWYGPAVLAEGPAERSRMLAVDGAELRRVSRGTLDAERPTCHVELTISGLTDDVVALREEHEMRYFFPRDLERFTRETGYELVSLSGFPNLALPPGKASWSALVVARAV